MKELSLVGLILLTGCQFGMATDGATGGSPPPVQLEPLTIEDLNMMLLIAGIDMSEKAGELTLTEKRIAAGICFSASKLHTGYDSVSEAFCGPLLAAFHPPVPVEKPTESVE